jgi:tetratricopeptide (TPR) repeat protein
VSRKINTYEPTDVNYHGGVKHGANIHAVSVQVNQYVWDMIKILNGNKLYGFDFQAKIGTKKTVIILRHEESEMLEKARKLLKEVQTDGDFLFLTKTKEAKKDKMVWILLGLILSIFFIGWLSLWMFEKDFFSIFEGTTSSPKAMESKRALLVEEVEIDIEKLNLLKESFTEQNSSIDEPIMKAMEMTTSVISSLVSDEEKEKYSSKNLVENFNGKGGIKFIVKDGNLSSDFNATIKELNSYADKFIKDGNIVLAEECYDRALKGDVNSSNVDEVLMTLINKSELYKEIDNIKGARASYSKILEITEGLVKDDFIKYGFIKAWSLTKFAEINQDINKSFSKEKALLKAESIYKSLLIELKRSSRDGKIVNQAILAWALNFLADFYFNDKEEYLVSIELRREASSVYKRLAETNPRKYQLLYYKTLNSLGKSYLKLNKMALANKFYTQGLRLSKALSPYYQALSLSGLGVVEMESKDFDRAKRYYQRALKIYKRLAQKNRKKYAVNLVAMESLFARLEEQRGNIELAREQYKRVILEYKKMNRIEPLSYNLDIARLLNRLAWVKFSINKNFLEAEIDIFEAISLSKKMKKIESREAKYLLSESYRYLAYLATLENNMPTAWEYYCKAENQRSLK